ncbi:MAG: ATP-binding protein [Chloroflexota bacterium]|nr:ATP-binding protein [Chloroflexota bacterium]
MTGLIEEKTATGFGTSLEHLLAELGRIDLMIRLRLHQARLRDPGTVEDEFRGLYISEGEVEAFLAGATPLFGDDAWSCAGDAGVVAIEDALEQRRREIARRKAVALSNGVEMRLHRLSQLFGLSAFDIDALLVCMLPEVDLRYERLYAYLHDDVTRKRPSIDLVLRLLCPALEERLAAREAFCNDAPLLKGGVLQVESDQHGRAASFLSQVLSIDQRVVGYLLGSDQLDARVALFAELVEPGVGWPELILPEDVKDRLRGLPHRDRDGLVCYLHGPYGVGRRTAAEAMCREAGVQLLVVDVGRLGWAEVSVEAAADLAMREASLRGGMMYWHGFEAVPAEGEAMLGRVAARLAGWSGVTLLGGEAPWVPQGWHEQCHFVSIEMPFPTHALRRRLWQAHLDGQCPGDDEVSALADRFHFTAGQIRDAVGTAESLALAEGRPDDGIGLGDLYRACRMQSNQTLSSLAKKIEPRYDWDDIVLPPDQAAQLREICEYVQQRHVVYGEWGFGGKLATGGGLNALFAGPSGTGKTMASEIIASELLLDLYKIDLSGVVSKYIGETEKNLDRVFREGRDSNAILLFDEADALFGKRSEVRDSHDRYANIEVAYLLQKMEEYEGIVIMATNLRKNVDEAFARRMHFAVEFPFPEEHYRHEIWKRVFPLEAPLAEDVDLAFLARQLKVTGGNIKNIALAAAFLAAADSSAIAMGHVIKGAKREYQKIGKLCTEADFGRYFDVVKG